MARYNHSYLICGKHIKEVEKFLEQYFDKIKTQYTFDNWLNFKIPKSNYRASLTHLKGQKLTQNMVFEISCPTLKELKNYSNKTKEKIHSFVATETGRPYRFYYLTIKGPANICKIEINYIEHLK